MQWSARTSMPHDVCLTVVCPLQMANIKLYAMEGKNKHASWCLSDCHVSIAEGLHQAACNGGEEQAFPIMSVWLLCVHCRWQTLSSMQWRWRTSISYHVCLSCCVTIADGQHPAACHGGKIQGVAAGIPGCSWLHSGDMLFPPDVHINMCWLPCVPSPGVVTWLDLSCVQCWQNVVPTFQAQRWPVVFDESVLLLQQL